MTSLPANESDVTEQDDVTLRERLQQLNVARISLRVSYEQAESREHGAFTSLARSRARGEKANIRAAVERNETARTAVNAELQRREVAL